MTVPPPRANLRLSLPLRGQDKIVRVSAYGPSYVILSTNDPTSGIVLRPDEATLLGEALADCGAELEQQIEGA